MDNKIKSLRFKKNPFHTRIKVEMIQLKDRKYSLREDRDRYFFPDEWKAFHDCLKKKQEITFDFLINTGARINECRNVKVGDIDFERNSIVFRWTKTRNKDGTRKIRTIPVSPQFAKYLKKFVAEFHLKDDDVFPILSTPAANIAMNKSLQEAGIPDWKMISIHNIRKTLETWLIALDVDSMKVIKHFGHGLAMALKHYVSPDVFGWEDKDMIREIIGDLYRETRR